MRQTSHPQPSASCSSSAGGLIAVDEAAHRIESSLGSLGGESVPLSHACGRILRETLHADRPQPPYRRATMDGIALRYQPGAASWQLAGLHAAGDPPPRALLMEEAWEIMTGAQMPDDCDTLIPYEELVIENATATLHGEVVPGRYIHEVGSDAQAGAVLVEAGATLGPFEIAIAASMGLSQVHVSARPVITLLTTGNEAIPINDVPQPWQIRRSNGPMLESLLRRDGWHEVHAVHCLDDPLALGEAFHHALQHSHAVLLCGGISKGKRDYVREVIEARCGAPAFHGIAQRPGKPMAFWSGPTPVFALPGNPVSVLATFIRFVRPALIQLQGGTPPAALQLPLAGEFKPQAKLTWHAPARLDGGFAHPLLPQNSGDFISIAGATHLLEIPPGTAPLPAGTLVTARPLSS